MCPCAPYVPQSPLPHRLLPRTSLVAAMFRIVAIVFAMAVFVVAVSGLAHSHHHPLVSLILSSIVINP